MASAGAGGEGSENFLGRLFGTPPGDERRAANQEEKARRATGAITQAPQFSEKDFRCSRMSSEIQLPFERVEQSIGAAKQRTMSQTKKTDGETAAQRRMSISKLIKESYDEDDKENQARCVPLSPTDA